VDATNREMEPAPIVDSGPRQGEWLSWAEEQVGGDHDLARSAAQAAITSLAEGLDSNAAAQHALAVVGVSSCRFTDGRAVLAGNRLIVQNRGITSSLPLDTLFSFEAKLERDNTVSLVVQVVGTATSQTFPGAESTGKAQAMLTAVQAADPHCRTGWTQPDVTAKRQVLRDRIVELATQGFVVLYQTDDQAQLKKPKVFNTNVFIVLLIVGFVLIELPMIIYLIVYLFKRDTVVSLHVDEWGRLIERSA